ncbi:hypothetical protein ABC337_11495 [Arthrobacter sp. 1P04PC]|uniref:hypothetical protein n=1 Tax=unclassified Arthrobacter TaxID=235627 RepID=UPI0039A02F8A
MGAQNVAKVFAHWRHLGHREARALAFMANTALDADNPPVYFGGWTAVAEALGYDAEGKRANAKEQFRRALSSLVAAGAVVSSGQARLGVRAEYALTLDPQLTYLPSGSGRAGRGIAWTATAREDSRECRESADRGTREVPQVDHLRGAPPATEKVPHVGHPEGGMRATQEVPPRSTEEPQGGIPEEEQGGTTIRPSYVTREPTRERESDSALDADTSLEDERARQLRELDQLIAEQKRKAS